MSNKVIQGPSLLSKASTRLGTYMKLIMVETNWIPKKMELNK